MDTQDGDPPSSALKSVGVLSSCRCLELKKSIKRTSGVGSSVVVSADRRSSTSLRVTHAGSTRTPSQRLFPARPWLAAWPSTSPLPPSSSCLMLRGGNSLKTGRRQESSWVRRHRRFLSNRNPRRWTTFDKRNPRCSAFFVFFERKNTASSCPHCPAFGCFPSSRNNG